MALSGNKGEWSEIYTLLKLLGETHVFAGKADLNRVENLFYPILKILRSEANGNFEYEIDPAAKLVFVSNNGERLLQMPVCEFRQQAANLLAQIKTASGASFSIAETEAFMHAISCQSLKAKSDDKADIRIVIHDLRTQTTPLLGFSIKSQLGGASTLLNAGQTTNFIYQIDGDLPAETIAAINAIDSQHKIKERISAIGQRGGKLRFATLEHSVFNNNLILIDSLLPNILAEALLLFFSSNLSTVKEITDYLEEENPLHFDTANSHRFYEYKMKRFLVDAALGMMPAKVWNGQYDATGGYLVVKDDGEIICYHIYNKNDFENYLLHNTKLETASSTRHHFGKIETVGKQLIFKLNLQVRFIR